MWARRISLAQRRELATAILRQISIPFKLAFNCDLTQLSPLWRAPDTGPTLDVLGVRHTYKAMGRSHQGGWEMGYRGWSLRFAPRLAAHEAS